MWNERLSPPAFTGTLKLQLSHVLRWFAPRERSYLLGQHGQQSFPYRTAAIALILWIYAIRLLRRIYRKFREDLQRAARRDTSLLPLAPVQPTITDTLIHRPIARLHPRATSKIREP